MLKKINLTKLGNNYCSKIDDFKIKESIIKYICNDTDTVYLNENIIESNEVLNKIKNLNYKIINLNNGNNYILLLKEINNIYYTVLIKKNFEFNLNSINFNDIEIYFLDILYSKEYFKGTILEGRLEIIDKESTFLLYDIVKFNGDDINSTLDEKKNILNKFIKKNKNFQFKVAEYLDLNKIKNESSGLLFIPNISNLKYYTYFNKSISKNYSNLYMKKLKTDVFFLNCIHNNSKKKIGIAGIYNLKSSLFFNKFIEEIKVKCWFNFKFNKWVPFELIEDDNIKITEYDDILIKIKKI